MKNNLGMRIKTMRMSRNMTQSDLANEMQVSRSTVGMWETGDREPNLDTLEALADLFNVPLGALVEKEKPANDGGLSENVQMLVDFAKSVPENKAAMILRVIQSIVGDESDSSSNSSTNSGK